MNATAPDYNAIYFDSNELLANGWPDPSVKLSNFLYIAHGWNLQAFIPLPVIDETEAHWWRAVDTQASRIVSAKKELERLARPTVCDVRVEYTNLEEMREQYKACRERALNRLMIGLTPYPIRTAEFFFQHATNYVMPFEKESEGKGFQDAVILQSVLEHLHSEGGLSGILITKDAGMRQSRIGEFLPEFDASRLRFTTLDDAWNNLFYYHFDQKVVQPWAEERKNALVAVMDLDSVLKDFLAAHLTEPMLRAGEFGAPATVLKLISVDSVEVSFVDTPIPDLDANPDRSVKISISISAQCTALVRKESFGFFSSLFGGSEQGIVEPASPLEVVQGKASWSGGIRATAEVVSHQFREIVPESVVSDEELRAQK
jgi:hypothetical protein